MFYIIALEIFVFNHERSITMIDFENGSVFKLHLVESASVEREVEPQLVADEDIIGIFKSIRDHIVFTNRRVIAVNVQGVTGKKRSFTTLPYSKIQSFTVETSGIFDIDSELELYYSGLGSVRFEFTGRSNVAEISQLIAAYIL